MAKSLSKTPRLVRAKHRRKVMRERESAPTFVFESNIDDETYYEFSAFLDQHSAAPMVRLFFNCDGGLNIDDLFSQRIGEFKGRTVAIIAKASSAATLVALACDFRIALADARMLFHKSFYLDGKPADDEIFRDSMERATRIANRVGAAVTAQDVFAWMKAERVLNVHEMERYGLVDWVERRYSGADEFGRFFARQNCATTKARTEIPFILSQRPKEPTMNCSPAMARKYLVQMRESIKARQPR